MGVTWRAYAVIGSKIDKSKVFHEDDVRCCEHALPDKNTKFCPECGAKAWERDWVSLPEFDDGEFLCGDHYCQAQLAGLPVVYPGPACSLPDGTPISILVAVAFAQVDEEGEMSQIKGTDLRAAKEKVKAALEPIGLWDEEAFGVWVMLSCS